MPKAYKVIKRTILFDKAPRLSENCFSAFLFPCHFERSEKSVSESDSIQMLHFAQHDSWTGGPRFRTGSPSNVYTVAPVNYGTLTTDDVARRISAESAVTPGDAKNVLDRYTYYVVGFFVMIQTVSCTFLLVCESYYASKNRDCFENNLKSATTRLI